MPSLAGTKLDKYEIIEEVGHGGMAVVYRGHDTVLEREVAVKVLHSHLADREESRARLQREALAVAKLRHDNILEIFDYSGSKTSESYIVTEFIHGPTMRQWVDEQLDPRPTIAAMIVHRLCLALCEAHRGSIVHRDIKPENVMIRKQDGALKLMDFGIAQIIDDQKLTLTGQLIGSPAYMAPELISGRPLDQRTDLFSLGILLYQLATGELPFSGRNPHEVLNRIADGDYPAPCTVCPLVDRDLEAIIAVALSTSPDERFQSAETFAKDLERYLEEMGVTPSTEELRTYFEDPVGYVEALDIRVAQTLMRRAHAAADDGQTARAIALLGRVLEIDGGHREARALLEKVRRRERRLRQVLLGAGALALTGLVAAGIMLTPQFDRAGQRYASADGRVEPSGLRTSAEAQETSPASDAPLSTQPGEPRDRGPTPSEPIEAPPAAAKDPAKDPAETGGDTIRVADVDASPRPPRPGRRPRRVNPPAPDPFVCELQLENIPLSTARNVKLQVGRNTRPITSTKMRVELGKPATASLSGGDWRGSVRLTPESCSSGSVRLQASPRPAVVRVSGTPVGTIVRCVEGCAKADLGANQNPERKLKPIPIKKGTSQEVKLLFRAPDHKDREIVRMLHPGEQTLKVRLDPRADP